MTNKRLTVIQRVTTVIVAAAFLVSAGTFRFPALADTDAGISVAESEAIDQPVKTQWQEKFAEHFTDEVVITENSYSSPNISITIDYFNGEREGANRIYYIADIYVASTDCLRTYTKENTLIRNETGLTDITLLDEQANAILSTNADDYSIQYGKLFYRNGVISDGQCTGSICVLYNDGVMETYNSRTYNFDELNERGIWQLWCFGPKLLDEEGHALSEDVMDLPSYSIEGDAPRTVIGYYEPGHYCLIVSEGRSDNARGFRTGQLARLCEEFGLTQAYNLDGGRSSTIIFNHEQLNTRSNGGSNIADIICVVEPTDIVEGPVV